MVKFKAIRLCKQDAMSIVPSEVLRYDLDKAVGLLEQKGYTTVMQGPMLIARSTDIEVTIYVSGRMLISRVENKERAAEVANRIYEAVEGALEPPVAKRP